MRGTERKRGERDGAGRLRGGGEGEKEAEGRRGGKGARGRGTTTRGVRGERRANVEWRASKVGKGKERGRERREG